MNEKMRGAMTRSKAQWYKFGEKNNKNFYNLEKINHKKKHITSLIKEDGNIVFEPRQILEEEEHFFREIYQSKNVCPESANLEFFFGWPEYSQTGRSGHLRGAVNTRGMYQFAETIYEQ